MRRHDAKLVVMSSDASALQRPAAFYLDSGEDPMFAAPGLHIGGNVAEVLFAEGIMVELSERLGLEPGFKRYEGQIVPVDRLGLLASLCRELSDRYNDDDTLHEGRTFTFKRQTGAGTTESTVTATASGAEIRASLTRLADLADEAAGQGVAILADL